MDGDRPEVGARVAVWVWVGDRSRKRREKFCEGKVVAHGPGPFVLVEYLRQGEAIRCACRVEQLQIITDRPAPAVIAQGGATLWED